MIRIRNIKIQENLNNKQLLDFAIKKFNIKKEDIFSWHISKKSIDARKKDNISYVYTLDFELNNELKYSRFEKVEDKKYPSISVNRTSKLSPIIVGAGPAGLFAALTLVQNGISPIIFEQGKPVEERQKDIEEFFRTGKLNPSSNVQFGEGGAGTFSDGKLTTGINNSLCQKVLEEFVQFGAPEEILYLSKPHIGTDNLISVISKMRKYLIKNGATFHFNEKVTDFKIKDQKIQSVITDKEYSTDSVILAIGHSARDTFEMLYSKNIQMEKKNFSVGLRIEHLQEWINKAQYGKNPNLKLPPAEYKLSHHFPNGRSCYTFCMCPGGSVIASSSEPNSIVTNGMSKFLRDGVNSNSALLVGVTPEDFASSSPLAGIYFQKNLEEKAFELGGKNFYAPVQRVEDFLNNTPSTKIGMVTPSYLPGVTLSNLTTIFPEYITSTLQQGILAFGTKLKGFNHPDSILTGVETRSSSPVRILRNEKLVSNIQGIYPCGEGAGYAGGIMSAAVDGIKCAIAVLEAK